MARVRIESARRPAGRRLAIAGAALAVGTALGLLLSQEPQDGMRVAANGAPATPPPAAAADSPCCAAPAAAAVPLPPPAPAPSAPGASPADVYREARHYADCLALQEPDRLSLADAADARYEVDPSGAFAAVLMRAEQEQRAACRGVGPYEFRQVDALMRDAAARGNTDARFFLLDRRVADALATAASLRERGRPGGTDAAVLADVESMALAGYRPAMTLTAQLLASGLLGTAEPQQAAAWQLAALQLQYPEPMTHDQLQGTGLFEELGPAEAQALRERAAALLERCCAAQGPAPAARP